MVKLLVFPIYTYLKIMVLPMQILLFFVGILHCLLLAILVKLYLQGKLQTVQLGQQTPRQSQQVTLLHLT